MREKGKGEVIVVSPRDAFEGEKKPASGVNKTREEAKAYNCRGVHACNVFGTQEKKNQTS